MMIARQLTRARHPGKQAEEAAFRSGSRVTMAFSASTLALNFMTGILIARSVGPSGRGALTSVLIVPTIAGFLVGLGASQTLSYEIARRPHDTGTLLGGWLVLMSLISIATIGLLQLFIPHILAAQSPQTVALGRLWTLALWPSLCLEILLGVLLGQGRFIAFNIARFSSVLVASVLYLVLWSLHSLTVEMALVSLGLGYLCALSIAAVWVMGKHRPHVPALEPMRRSLWYGIRAHGNMIGTIANARLDLLILPAMLAASQVGLYSVASNISWIVVTVAGAASALLLPTATRQGEIGAGLVISALRTSLLVACSMALAEALMARPILALAYGNPFLPSLAPLLILLPGSVCYAGAYVLWAGLGSLGRPGAAALSQLPGVIITVGGLSLFLARGGIAAAAIISAASYFAVFVTALGMYIRFARLNWLALWRSDL